MLTCRPGARLQRAVTAARIEWPLDEYRAEELQQLTDDDDNQEAEKAPQPEKEEIVKRRLTDEEAETIRAKGSVSAQARAVGLSNSTLATALDRVAADRRKLDTEVIDALLALPREVIAKHTKKQGGARAPLAKREAAPEVAPAPAPIVTSSIAPALSLRERALELYLTGSELDRATLRALLGIGGAL